MTLATTHSTITVKPVWLRSGWWDFLREFWNDFSSDGKLDDLGYDSPSEMGKTDTGSLGLVDTLAPGTSGSYRFILPGHSRTGPTVGRDGTAPLTRNRYARRFSTSWAVASYLVEHFERLERSNTPLSRCLIRQYSRQPTWSTRCRPISCPCAAQPVSGSKMAASSVGKAASMMVAVVKAAARMCGATRRRWPSCFQVSSARCADRVRR